MANPLKQKYHGEIIIDPRNSTGHGAFRETYGSDDEDEAAEDTVSIPKMGWKRPFVWNRMRGSDAVYMTGSIQRNILFVDLL
jgi:hypothetical protein